MRQTQVHVVDDDPTIRTHLAALFEVSGHSIELYEDGGTFLRAFDTWEAPEHTGGCLIVDYHMPEVDGLVLHKHLRAANSALSVVMLTGYHKVAVAVEAMRNGVFEFLEKPVRNERLLETVDSALNASTEAVERNRVQSQMRERIACLSRREQQVLRLHLKGWPAKQVATDLKISHRTVETHIRAIYQKLPASSLAQCIHIALQSGFIESTRELEADGANT